MPKFPFTTSISGPGAETIDEAHFHRPSVDYDAGRRAFLRSSALGIAGAGALASGLLPPSEAHAQAISDAAIFNFALNSEYLESEYYLRGSRGTGLDGSLITGIGTLGDVRGGSQVPFQDRVLANFFSEVAGDELAHVRLLRSLLGGGAIARPAINLNESFTIAARAAGIINDQQTFNPFADQIGFLLGSFLLVDVGVSAYAGSSGALSDPNNIGVAGRILAVEGYHAGTTRAQCYIRGLFSQTQAISNVRNRLDGPEDSDQGIGDATNANITPTDGNGLGPARTPQQVLAILYENGALQPGGFLPNGANGAIR